MGYDMQAARLDDLKVPSGHKLYQIIKPMKLQNIKYGIMLSQREWWKLSIMCIKLLILGFIKLQAPEFLPGNPISLDNKRKRKKL